jgi:hypothetical protein
VAAGSWARWCPVPSASDAADATFVRSAQNPFAYAIVATGWFFVINCKLEVAVMTPEHAFTLAVAIINFGAAALKFASSRTPQEKTFGF